MQNAMLDLTFREGHVVDSCIGATDQSRLIKLAEAPQSEAPCSSCQQVCVLVHERRWRRVRERDLFDRRLVLDVPIREWTAITVERGAPSRLPGLPLAAV